MSEPIAALTEGVVRSLLVAEGGKVKKSDLVEKFRASLDCADPAEKGRNRARFKVLVNNVAVVKEIDGVRYVVVRKTHKRLPDGVAAAEEKDGGGIRPAGELRRPAAEGSAVPEPDPEPGGGGGGGGGGGADPEPAISPLQRALQRSRETDIRVQRRLGSEIQTPEPRGVPSKRYGLPLRMPPTRVEICKLKVAPDEAPGGPTADALRNKRPPSTDTDGGGGGSPQMRWSEKSTKEAEEPRDTRGPSLVPLEPSEHEWLVKCAAGHWSQVYGLLLRDSGLAEKRDFMSGFTALHWAAKTGNSKMLVKIVDLAKQGGVKVDINAKTHGGYTPLHIAALHDQEYVMAMLVGEFGADASVRDNCGKRAYHYLHKGISGTVREMLGEPRAQQAQDRAPQEREDPELFPDLPKGLQSLGRLFQPQGTGFRKKPKQRPGLFSQSDDPEEPPGPYSSSSSYRPRVLGDVFM